VGNDAPFRVEWTENGLDGWRRLALDQAKVVAAAVERSANTGDGVASYAEGVYLLFVGVHAVEMLIDVDTIFVLRVRRA
jgi:hypothetical protein